MAENVNVELLIRHVKYRLRPFDSIIVSDILNQSKTIQNIAALYAQLVQFSNHSAPPSKFQHSGSSSNWYRVESGAFLMSSVNS